MPEADLDKLSKKAAEDTDRYVVSFDDDVSNEEFNKRVMPYAIGYMGNTHGLTDVSYQNKTLVFERLADEA